MKLNPLPDHQLCHHLMLWNLFSLWTVCLKMKLHSKPNQQVHIPFILPENIIMSIYLFAHFRAIEDASGSNHSTMNAPITAWFWKEQRFFRFWKQLNCRHHFCRKTQRGELMWLLNKYINHMNESRAIRCYSLSEKQRGKLLTESEVYKEKLAKKCCCTEGCANKQFQLR